MKIWTVDDVMTRAVVSAEPATTFREIVDLLADRRISALPVVDEAGRVIGVVSETDLLRKVEYAGGSEPRIFDGPRRRDDRRRAQGRTAAELMTTRPVVVSQGTSITSAARMMDEAGVKRLPVVDARGRLIGIVTRGDLLKVHLRPDEEILADVRINVVERFLPGDAETVIVTVVNGVVALDGKVDRWSSADIAERLSRQIAGVVDVVSTLEYSFDDSRAHGSRLGFGTR
ncbi:CBS domain-containing protein [Actinoplanes sp. KI2]|uniref:CBS domain-containing protein n=1 Tax=Actinoplanes sp. KI2 TaxID=2983315 RepID=UPI0021D5C846|nr:CBS domain-containing protein [Actinoplanes sp. KI2]MCU7731108.1 CBS domain-containing protein [Actinoplanes sp. KI2]